MNIDLYILLQTLQVDIVKKYDIKTIKIVLDEGVEEQISVKFLHSEIKDKINIVDEILKYILSELKEKQYVYKHSPIFPNAIHISSVEEYDSIKNETTMSIYSLIKI